MSRKILIASCGLLAVFALAAMPQIASANGMHRGGHRAAATHSAGRRHNHHKHHYAKHRHGNRHHRHHRHAYANANVGYRNLGQMSTNSTTPFSTVAWRRPHRFWFNPNMYRTGRPRLITGFGTNRGQVGRMFRSGGKMIPPNTVAGSNKAIKAQNASKPANSK